MNLAEPAVGDPGDDPGSWIALGKEEARLTALGYPPSLIKACCDPFDYALGLRDGTVLHFHEAHEHGSWVHLNVIERFGWPPGADPPHPFPFDRGLDVRVSDIVWCADAPYGS